MKLVYMKDNHSSLHLRFPLVFFLLCYCILTLLCGYSVTAQAQKVPRYVSGVVTDKHTKEKLSFITVSYAGKGVGVITDNGGNYRLIRNDKWNQLTFSSVGYKTRVINLAPSTRYLNVQLEQDNVQLDEVIVKPKRERYRRKENPAVALMKKVISHKRAQRLSDLDQYRYHKYSKMKTSLNDITPEKMEKGLFKQFPLLKNQVEVSPENNKLILPVSLQETASLVLFNKDPKRSQTIIQGERSDGLQDLFYTGDMFETILNDVFADVDIYDNNIRLLQRRFISPISDNAVTFYKYYLMDTIKVERDTCIHLSFVPYNSQDFGFTGHLYILKDSTYAVKRCTMNLPIKTGVNFVEDMNIDLSYYQMPNGKWVISEDAMTVDLALDNNLQGVQIKRTNSYSAYDFSPIPDDMWSKSKLTTVTHTKAEKQAEGFWEERRTSRLTSSEKHMDEFVDRLRRTPKFRFFLTATKILVENYLETNPNEKTPNYFDIGPISTFMANTYVDGLRLKLGGNTTTAFNKRLFLSGYGAYGFKDKKWKYDGKIAYSFHDCKEFLWDYPQEYIQASYHYDVHSPMDKWSRERNEGLFNSLRTSPDELMSYVKEAKLDYVHENETGFMYTLSGRWRNDEATGKLAYIKNDDTDTRVGDFSTSEVTLQLRYAPGEKIVTSKQRRRSVSRDAPIVTVSHTHGFKGILGSHYTSDRSQIDIENRFWLGRWGKLDFLLSAGAEWKQVPFPLLMMPQASLSYSTYYGAFNLMRNMEFMSDRYAELMLYYDMNGRLLNRIPLLHRLKWREYFTFKAYYGDMTNKNNPDYFDVNHPNAQTKLFRLPTDDGVQSSYIMNGGTPYMEGSVGIYNIFKVLAVEYVHRFNYMDHPDVDRNGVRFRIEVQF